MELKELRPQFFDTMKGGCFGPRSTAATAQIE